MQTLPQLRERALEREAKLIRRALDRHGWRMGPAARELGVSDMALRRACVACGLWAEYEATKPRPGRPSKD